MTKTAPPSIGLELRQLVQVPALRLRVVVGSEWAMSRVVSWAHATEMADPRPHLRGGELVCTVGAALLDAALCGRLVEAVHASDSAGICLGLGEFHSDTPQALIQECRRMSVPLIEMAHGVPFLAINDVLADARIQAQVGTNRRNSELVGTLLAALREDAPIGELLQISARALGGWLTFELADATQATRPVTAVPPVTHDVLRSASFRTVEGNLLIWRGQSLPPDTDLLGQIGRILDISRHEKIDQENQNRQRIGQLFTLVAEGLADSAALMPELQVAGLAGKPLTVSAWPAETAPLLADRLPAALIADAPGATFVVTTGSAFLLGAARDLGLICGYGSPVDAVQISRGIGEARATLNRALRQGRVAGPEGLTTLSGLLEQQPPVRLVPFIDQLIGPLLDHDRSRGSQLLSTLRTFIEQHGALQATADIQYLHVNTVRHRLARITTIVGRNPLDDGDRVSFSIALWAYDRSRRPIF